MERLRKPTRVKGGQRNLKQRQQSSTCLQIAKSKECDFIDSERKSSSKDPRMPSCFASVSCWESLYTLSSLPISHKVLIIMPFLLAWNTQLEGLNNLTREYRL